MLSFINHIQSVSKYESKLLMRSWFFRIFTLMAVFFLTLFNLVTLVFEDGGNIWCLKAISSNIPYFNLLVLNVGQAIVAIFLASDFMKRDKKLDTSEVFYVRPLSNAEYLLGKIWGNIRVFLFICLIITVITSFITLMSPDGLSVDWVAYLIYLLIICIPTLVFIIGLSIFLMLVLKNQALTFILLLGYIGLTLFYIGDFYYYLFDYMAIYLPLLKSSIVGFTNLEAILTHRAIYLFAGLGFIFLTISLFMRLPNSRRSNYPWIALAVCMFLLSGVVGYLHVHTIKETDRLRASYVAINNKYADTPKLAVDEYTISIEQHPESFSAEVKLKGVAMATSAVFTFCLNPGLMVQSVTGDGGELKFERDQQILLVDAGRTVAEGDAVSLSIQYEGHIENAFCYLDISAKEMAKEYRVNAFFSSDKQYSFQTDNYLLFTPETYWYPRPGTTYSDEVANWQQSYFSRYRIHIKTLPGLTPLSHGDAVANEDGTYSFLPEYLLPGATVVAGRYKQQQIWVDSVSYSIWHIEGHDFYSAAFDSIPDTIPGLVRNFKENLERAYHLPYLSNRLSIIEIPAQFYCYPHAWAQAQETIQPEMVLFIEKGWLYESMDVKKRVANHRRWGKRSGQNINEEEAQIRGFNEAISMFQQPEGSHDYTYSGNRSTVVKQANPYFLFPLLYNFQYNVYSPEWSIANRIVELYLQNSTSDMDWERDLNGISNNEKVNLLMAKYSLRELLSDVTYKDLQSNMIGLKARELFAPAEISRGINNFRDSVFRVLERNAFRNLRLEYLLDTLSACSGTSLPAHIATWYEPERLPRYRIEPPEVTRIMNKGKETFVTKLWISNDSDTDGIVHLKMLEGDRQGDVSDPKTDRNVLIPAQQVKQLIFTRENAPREITINTLISGNLPSILNLPVTTIKQDKGLIPEEGDYIVSGSVFNAWGEVVVDNEDSLFSVSETEVFGLLPKWLNQKVDTTFKYAGISWWRPPLKWTPTTNAGYYGKYVRSAYVIKSGSGNQTATWRVPVPMEGYYEVYCYVFKNEEMKNNADPGSEYHFRIHYGEESEDAYLSLGQINGGWELLGSYYFAADTIRVSLSNQSKVRSVAADAVKIVKR